MTLSIIIVNWNVKPLLERCLSSIRAYGKGLSYEIFVVDNASRNGSQEYLKGIARTRKNFRIILNKENFGFARANNQAISKVQGEFILFLNPDTEIYPGTLQKMVNFLQAHEDCGIVGAQLIGVDGRVQPSVRNFPTLGSQVMIFLKLHYLFPHVRCLKNYFLYNFDYISQQKVDQVMGACLLTRREVLDEIGPLDENFYLWFEEVDFCKRVKDADWEVVYLPGARIFHHGAQSFRQLISLRKQKIYNASAIYYFKKHFGPAKARVLAVLNPLSLFLAYLAQIARPRTLTRFETRLNQPR